MAGLALLTNTDLLLPILGGLFVVETLSVIAQVVAFRGFHRRVLRMAPIHHHYEVRWLARVHGHRALLAVRRALRRARPRALLRRLHPHPGSDRLSARPRGRAGRDRRRGRARTASRAGDDGHRASRTRPDRRAPRTRDRERPSAGAAGRWTRRGARRRRARRAACAGRPRRAEPGCAARHPAIADRERGRRRPCGPRSTSRPSWRRLGDTLGRGHRHQRQDHRHHARSRHARRVGRRRGRRRQHRAARLLDAVASDVDVVVAEVSSFQLAFTDRGVPAPGRGAAQPAPTTISTGTGRSTPTSRPRRRSSRTSAPTTLLVFNADDEVVAGLATTAPAQRVGFARTAAGPCTDSRAACSSTRRGSRSRRRRAPGAAAPHDRRQRAGGRRGRARRAARRRRASTRVLPRLPGLPTASRWSATLAGCSTTTTRRRPTRTPRSPRSREASGHVVLIAGGRNKGLDLAVLATLAPRLRAVVAIGEAARRDRAHAFADAVPVVQAASMGEAVAHRRPSTPSRATPCCSRRRARRSTGTPSYGARGDDFAREVDAPRAKAGTDDACTAPRHTATADRWRAAASGGAGSVTRRRPAPSNVRCC